jgi:hypothetical protein
MGTDTFVVRDGKIVAQSFTGKIRPRAENRPSFREIAQQGDQLTGYVVLLVVLKNSCELQERPSYHPSQT